MSLDEQGWEIWPNVLDVRECARIVAMYEREDLWRSRVVMQRHGFGRGEYKYFRYPLPKRIAELRTTFYEKLVDTGNRWEVDAKYPPTHAEYVKRCQAAGQTEPTPLLLAYGAGDYNCLHQDLYGEHVFPLQVAILLSDDFTGGEFVMTEQRPRMQSGAMVVPLKRGDAVALAVHHRPVHGTRGTYKVNLRHGVSQILTGSRHTLGIIFHDATPNASAQAELTP